MPTTKKADRSGRIDSLATKVKETVSDRIEIPAPQYDIATVQIYGLTDNIQECFSEKMQTAILDKHRGKAAGPRAIRKPEEEYEALKYHTPDGREGMKASAFYQAAIWTATTLVGLNGKKVKAAMQVLGDIVPLLGYEVKGGKIVNTPAAIVRMGQDTGKDARGTARIMFRPYYSMWRVVLSIQYRPDMLSQEQLVNLLTHAGFSSGVGAHRPSSPKKAGSHGKFTLSKEEAIAFYMKNLEVAS